MKIYRTIASAMFLLACCVVVAAQVSVGGDGVSLSSTLTINGTQCTIGASCTVSAPSSGITVGTTAIAGGTTTRVLYDNAGVLGEYTNTQLTALINVATASLNGALPAWPNNTTTFFRGDGTYQTLNCAAISGVGTGCSSAAGISALTGDVTATGPGSSAATLATVNSNVGTFGSATQSVQLTVNGKGLVTAAAGVTVTPAVGSITGLGTGVATWLATPSSANLASAVTDETGSGALVFATSPTLVTPALGAATATTINGVTIDNNAWSTYTPTATCAVGSITTDTITGRYKIVGKTIFISIVLAVTTVGTCTGNVSISTPSGGTVNTTGSTYALSVSNSSTNLAQAGYTFGPSNAIILPFAAAIANQTYLITGVYETT